MTLPNFLVIGAAKSGTTSLHHYLREHPDIFTPALKEPRYFALAGNPRAEALAKEFGPWQGSIYSFDAYEKLFEGSSGYTAVGECSPIYLYSDLACQEINNTIPNVRLIAILRNPLDRAFSHYGHNLRKGFDQYQSFEQYISQHQYIIELGNYSAQLEKYLSQFSREQFRVFLFDDLLLRPRQLIQNVYSFLGVDNTFVPKLQLVHNAAPPSPGLFKTLKLRIKRFTNPEDLKDPKLLTPMSKSTRKRLIELYQPDVEKIETLIKRDLSHWLI